MTEYHGWTHAPKALGGTDPIPSSSIWGKASFSTPQTVPHGIGHFLNVSFDTISVAPNQDIIVAGSGAGPLFIKDMYPDRGWFAVTFWALWDGTIPFTDHREMTCWYTGGSDLASPNPIIHIFSGQSTHEPKAAIVERGINGGTVGMGLYLLDATADKQINQGGISVVYLGTSGS